MSREDSLEEMVARRNKRLLQLFTVHGFNVRLVGDNQKPNVILNDVALLSCYVKNFDLHFTKEPFSDDIVKSFKLKSETEVAKHELQEAIELCIHRPVYKIKHIDTGMYLVGFNYLDSHNTLGRYPVFALCKPKVYFDKEYAIKLIDSLGDDGYKLTIE